MIKKILDWIFGKSSDEQKEDYLKNNPYPKKSKIFVDNRGNISQIIGLDSFSNVNRELKKKIKFKHMKKNIRFIYRTNYVSFL